MEFNKAINNLEENLVNVLMGAPEKYRPQLLAMNWILKSITNDIKNPNVITVTKSNGLNKLTDSVLAHDIMQIINRLLVNNKISSHHLGELRRQGGCISGSFVLNCIRSRLCGSIFHPNDIDIFIPVSATTKVDAFGLYKIKIVDMLIKDLKLLKMDKLSYNLVDGIRYTTMYVDESTNMKYNFIYVEGNIHDFIMSFDFSCCKNAYDGENLLVAEEQYLLNGQSTYNYNRILLEKIYQNKSLPYFNSIKNNNLKLGYGGQNFLVNNHLYARYKELYDIFFSKNLNMHTYYDKNVQDWVTLKPWHNYDLKIKTLKNIQEYFPIICDKFDAIQQHKLSNNGTEIIQEEIDIMNIIRCHDRITKYTERGIKFIENANLI